MVGDAEGRPHAVLSASNPQGLIPQETLETVFGDLGKIEQITQGDYETVIDYGPDGERWRSVLEKNDTVKRTVLYADDYEMVTSGSTPRHFYYPGNGIIVMKEGSTVTPLVAIADHLGSITQLQNSRGTVLFSARYDAWGQQTVTTNTIDFQRGYCAHEMLPEYGLINMNGRLYDPLLGRFLSPDNYVQQPDNSQNFNRYSYCLNNPLKYNDPSGDLFTWMFGKKGFSLGLNFGFFGFGLNFGGFDSPSVGIYGELGPRVGGTGFGAGATLSQSLDYSIWSKSFSTSSIVGVYGSLGLFNAGGNATYTYGKNGGWSWNVNAGVNLIGTDEEGLGLNVGYGSDGWNFGLGGYFDSNAWDDNPEYEPDKWNDDNIRPNNNCYSYALDIMMDKDGLQPGYSQGKRVSRYSENYNSEILELALADGRIKRPTLLNKLGFGKKGNYKVYLVFGTYIDHSGHLAHDYHWYRQDKKGQWSHKPGYTGKVKNVDASGSIIMNPVKANHHYQTIFYNQGGIILWVRRK